MQRDLFFSESAEPVDFLSDLLRLWAALSVWTGLKFETGGKVSSVSDSCGGGAEDQSVAAAPASFGRVVLLGLCLFRLQIFGQWLCFLPYEFSTHWRPSGSLWFPVGQLCPDARTSST